MENVKKLEFDRKYFKNGNFSKIIIKNAILELNEYCNIIKMDKTEEYEYQAVVQLEQPDLCNLMKEWEKQINEYLKGEGISPITI